jgi:hypothetical protein
VTRLWRRTPRRPARASLLALTAAAALVGGCALAGWWLTQRGVRLHLGSTYPITGHYQPHLTGWLLAPLLIAAGVWRAGPRLAGRLPWPALLAAGYLTAAGWAVALAVAGGGPDAIGQPLATRWEYLAEVDRIDAMGVAAYLRGFLDLIVEGYQGGTEPGWATHVAGHPPLLTLLFVLLARTGLAGPGWAGAVCVAVGAAVVPAVLATVRLLAGEGWARRSAPFLAAAPVALWVATSADAIIAGVAATGVAVIGYAAARVGAGSLALAGLAGLLLGGALLLSYGMALLAPLVLAVVVAVRGWRRAVPTLLAGAVGVAGVLAGFAAAGFWWLDGLARTAQRVRIGEGWSDRPTGYFLFSNPAALAVAVGPAVVAALPLLWRLRHRLWPALAGGGEPAARLAVPAVAALLAVAAATASNLSKGEVERIWLPFAVWLLALAALLPRIRADDRPARGWLAAHLGWPLLIAAGTTLSW